MAFKEFPNLVDEGKRNALEDMTIAKEAHSKYILNKVFSDGSPINDSMAEYIRTNRTPSDTEFSKDFWNNLTEAEREEFINRRAKVQQDKFNSKPAAEREKILAERGAHSKKIWENKDSRQKEAFAQMVKDNWALKSPEERKLHAAIHRKAVICEGVEYESILAATEALGVSRTTLTFRLKSDSPRWANFYFKES